MTPFRTTAAAAWLVVAMTGCSTPADIQRQDGRIVADSPAEAARRAADAFEARPVSERERAAHIAAGRSRIDSGRHQARARFGEQESACWQRFLVNACLEKARLQRRTTLAELQQDELTLDEIERRQRTAERKRQLGQRESK